ncbi:MAG: hypothetical protein ACREMY_01740 [bacterium]
MESYISIATSVASPVESDLAAALMAALRGEKDVTAPEADDFESLLKIISQTTQLISHLELFREQAIAQADATGPTADRRSIGIAAGMAPSRIYRILERYGRPRRREYESYDEQTQRMLASLVKGHIVEGSYQGKPFVGSYVSQNADEDGTVWLVLTDHATQKPIVVPVTAASAYHYR